MDTHGALAMFAKPSRKIHRYLRTMARLLLHLHSGSETTDVRTTAVSMRSRAFRRSRPGCSGWMKGICEQVLPATTAMAGIPDSNRLENHMLSRRRFLQSSLTAALVPMLPRFAFAQTTSVLVTRPSWQTLCGSPLYQVYVDTIRKMRANKNRLDPNSWNYWSTAHMNYGLHKVPYFLAWHRGFLCRLESQMRIISGNASLALPYWDYFTTPVMPAEFTSDTTSPLFMPNRAGTDVTKALSLSPFADSITNFQRGLTNAFEPALESLPHNPVHNLIGGIMSSVSYSPKDPIFWLHHANIDRLWGAWCDAGNGRSMPASTDPYWSGFFNYGAGVPTVDRIAVISPAALGYQYENDTMPTALPVAPLAAVSTFQLQAAPSKPLTVQAGSLGGIQPLSLDQRSISVDVPLTTQDGARARSLLLNPAASTQSSGGIRVVLDGVRLTALGKRGGYFYKVYVNLPEQGRASLPESAYLLGTFGAFEISEMAMMRNGMMIHDEAQMRMQSDDGVQLSFPATAALQKIWPAQLDKVTLSFVRVDGSAPGKGTVITMKQFRVETTDAPAE
jgi:tyrosinase